MELLLLRHAQTAGNLEKRYIGATDEPLCPAGEAAARAAAGALAFFKPERLICTPLVRAKQTAALLFPGAPLEENRDLREMDFGAFEGKNYLELANDPAYAGWLASGCEAPCPGGEDKAAFTLRCRAGFERTVARCAARGEERVALIVHGGTLMAVMSGYADPARDYFDWAAANCGGYLCRLVPLEFNQTKRMRLEREL